MSSEFLNASSFTSILLGILIGPNLAAIPSIFFKRSRSEATIFSYPIFLFLLPVDRYNEILRVSLRIHYVEYLVRKIRLTQLEPLPLLNMDDLEMCVRRAGLKLPANWYGREPEYYRNDLVKVNIGGEPHVVGLTKILGTFPPQAALH